MRSQCSTGFQIEMNQGMRTTIMDRLGHYERAWPPVGKLAWLLSMTGFAKRAQRRWVLGWLRLTTMHLAQIAIGLSLRF